jgi:hypothetical protein
VLAPEVVLRLSAEIARETTPYARTVRAVRASIAELRRAHAAGSLKVPAREVPWLDMLATQADDLPETEEALVAEVAPLVDREKCLLSEYGL